MVTEIKIVDAYVALYMRRFKSMGFKVDRGDILSEIGFAYAKSIKKYPCGDGKAKFTTYAIKAFKYQMADYARKLYAQCLEESGTCVINDNIEDELQYTAEQLLEDLSVKRAFLKQFSGERLVVAKELVSPSDKVLACTKSILAKKTRQVVENDEKLGLALKSNSLIILAISLVYDIPKRRVRRHVTNIRRTVQKIVDFRLTVK